MHWGLSESLDLYEEYMRALKGLPPLDFKPEHIKDPNTSTANEQGVEIFEDTTGAQGDGEDVFPSCSRSRGGEAVEVAELTEALNNAVCNAIEESAQQDPSASKEQQQQEAEQTDNSACQQSNDKYVLKLTTDEPFGGGYEKAESTVDDINLDNRKESTCTLKLIEEISNSDNENDANDNETALVIREQTDEEQGQPEEVDIDSIIRSMEQELLDRANNEDAAKRYKQGSDTSPASPKETSNVPDSVDDTPPNLNAPISRKVNILLFGAGDPRHVIHTIAKLYKHKQNLAEANAENSNPVENIEFNFFMLDGCIEIVARNIALLSIALEQPDILPLRNKVHLFMDVFGNSMLRPSSHQYMAGKAKMLRNIITEEATRQRMAPFIDIESLKYTERDSLENAFNFWLPKDGHYYNIQQYWTNRNRVLLGSRFDYREGAFDWDLSMTLKDRGASQICSQEYRHWRETGIAFTYPEYEQCKPNKTFASALVRNGPTYLHRGYIGDLQTGPFCAFGVKCNDTRMTNSNYGDNDYRSTDITERNLLEYFYELENRQPYEHDITTSRRYGSAKLLMGKTLQWNECDINTMQDYDKPWLSMEGVTIKFLPLSDVFNMQNDMRGQYKEMFDIAFVGHNYFSFLKPKFAEVLKENSLLILETKIWTVGRKDDVNQFERQLKTFAVQANLKSTINYNALNTKYSSLKFKKVPANKVSGNKV